MALTVTWSSSRCSLSIRSSAEAEHSWLKGKSKMENPDTQPAGNCQTKSSQVSFATCRRFLGSSMPPTEDEQLEFPFIFTPTVSSPHWRWSLARSLSWIVLFEKLLSHFVWGGWIFRTTDRSQSIWLVLSILMSAPFSQILWASQMLWLPQFYSQMLWLRSVGDDVPAWSPKNRKNRHFIYINTQGKCPIYNRFGGQVCKVVRQSCKTTITRHEIVQSNRRIDQKAKSGCKTRTVVSVGFSKPFSLRFNSAFVENKRRAPPRVQKELKTGKTDERQEPNNPTRGDRGTPRRQRKQTLSIPPRPPSTVSRTPRSSSTPHSIHI